MDSISIISAAVMVVVFVAALLLPFPRGRSGR